MPDEIDEAALDEAKLLIDRMTPEQRREASLKLSGLINKDVQSEAGEIRRELDGLDKQRDAVKRSSVHQIQFLEIQRMALQAELDRLEGSPEAEQERNKETPASTPSTATVLEAPVGESREVEQPKEVVTKVAPATVVLEVPAPDAEAEEPLVLDEEHSTWWQLMTGWQWFFGIVLAIIFLIISRHHSHWFTQELKLRKGSLSNLFSVVWSISFIVFGFYLGRLIGFYIPALLDYLGFGPRRR